MSLEAHHYKGQATEHPMNQKEGLAEKLKRARLPLGWIIIIYYNVGKLQNSRGSADGGSPIDS